MINNGFVKIHRKILDNPISDKPNYLAVWLFLIIEANHKDTAIIFDNRKMIIKRGQCLTSIRKISKKFKLSVGSVQNILKYLISERMVERANNPQCSLITVLNYDRYQEVERKSVQALNKSCTSRETNKNDKNEKNEKKEIHQVSEFLIQIPDEEVVKATTKYNVTNDDVTRKGEELYNWVKSKKGIEKRYLDFRRLLQNALAKDFGYREMKDDNEFDNNKLPAHLQEKYKRK